MRADVGCLLQLEYRPTSDNINLCGAARQAPKCKYVQLGLGMQAYETTDTTNFLFCH